MTLKKEGAETSRKLIRPYSPTTAIVATSISHLRSSESVSHPIIDHCQGGQRGADRIQR
ncbi:hypothetical protein BaRGS_00032469, partial [Batillaria attramentaria]